MPTPSAQLGLPQIAGSDSPDVPRDLNAVIARFEAIRNTYATLQVREVGDVGQIRAGRPLTVADFTAMGLSTPLLLANLSVLAGAGSNLGSGGNLTNKGAVVNAPGIMGAAGEAAQFAGSTGQALWIPDTGSASDPFRIRNGSWGSWFRTSKWNSGTAQELVSKAGVAAQTAFISMVNANNVVQGTISTSGSDSYTVAGTTLVTDGRWHFFVTTSDGTRMRLYVDGMLESEMIAGNIFGGATPLCIGLRAADATFTAAGVNPHYDRIDEVFVTADVLSDEQQRYLYCASLAHTLPITPKRLWLGVRRQKRGGPIVVGDFPSTPNRLHNFAAGAVANEGSDANGAAGTTATLLPNPGTGVINDVAGPDGKPNGAKNVGGAHTGLSATDTGLPAALTARSAGAWFKYSVTAGTGDFLAWGTPLTADFRLGITGGILQSASGADGITGPRVDDGLWHFAFVVEDNAAPDHKRKLYVDGRVFGVSNVLTSLTLAGANRFRLGAASDGTRVFAGQVARPSVYSGALTPEQVRAIYNKGSQALPYSPKSEGDHVEAFEPVRALVVFDALLPQDTIDLALTA